MRHVRLLVVTALAIAVAGCSDPLAPYQPEITNAPGNFQFQATAMQNVALTREYTWQNAGTTANVDRSSAITAGTATLIVRDAQGTQVYTTSLATNGNQPTAAGVAGAWTIRVVFTGVSGTVNFRLQTP